MKKFIYLFINYFAIIFLFIASASQLIFAQESWTPTSTGTNVPSPRTGHSAVWTGDAMIIWGGRGTNWLNTGGIYNPSSDTWTSTDISNAPITRNYHTAVWTGSRMIVWGGQHNGENTNTGGIYDPSTDSWNATSTTNAPLGRFIHTAVWTGTKMIVWGGVNAVNFPVYYNTGGIYDPLTDTWSPTSTANAPVPRAGQSVVWTGSTMIVWGGGNSSMLFNTGGIYNPSTDSWTSTSTINAPNGRTDQTAIWTGSKMIIWGGRYANGVFNTGGIYDPVTDTWASTSTVNAPSPRAFHSAIWSGSKMIIWGGDNTNNLFLNSGGIYDPFTDSWMPTLMTNVPTARSEHSAIWTGSTLSGKMIVWGGYNNNSFLNTGGIYTNSAVIGIEKISTEIPKQFSLSQNYPNPFNPSTKIRFEIPGSSVAQTFLSVYDVLGKEIATLVNEQLKPGTYSVDWNAADYPSGVYFYKLAVGDYSVTKKMVLIK